MIHIIFILFKPLSEHSCPGGDRSHQGRTFFNTGKRKIFLSDLQVFYLICHPSVQISADIFALPVCQTDWSSSHVTDELSK